MAELPQIGPQEPVAPPKVPATVSVDDQPFTAKPFAPLVGFMDMGESDMSNKNQTLLQEIWDYLGETSKSETTIERLHALRSLENRLSPPKLGQSRLQHVHNYVKAQQLVKQAEQWRDGHMKGIV